MKDQTDQEDFIQNSYGLLPDSSCPFDTPSRRGFNPSKLAYDLDRSDGRLDLTASAFNRLGQYTVVIAVPTAMQHLPLSSLADRWQ